MREQFYSFAANREFANVRDAHLKMEQWKNKSSIRGLTKKVWRCKNYRRESPRNHLPFERPKLKSDGFEAPGGWHADCLTVNPWS